MFRERRHLGSSHSASPSRPPPGSNPSPTPVGLDEFEHTSHASGEAAIPREEDWQTLFREFHFQDDNDGEERHDESDLDEDDDDGPDETEKLGGDEREDDDDASEDRRNKGNDDHAEDDDAAGEDSSLVGTIDNAPSDRSGTSKNTSAVSGLMSTFSKIGTFVKRELHKRKTGAGTRKVYARIRAKNKETHEMNNVRCAQRLAPHTGPIWTMEFSPAPYPYLATAGRDAKIVVFEYNYDANSQTESQGQTQLGQDSQRSSTTASPLQSNSVLSSVPVPDGTKSVDDQTTVAGLIVAGQTIFKPRPVKIYLGHTGDITALAWSKSLFLASGSTDKTCRIWHITSDACLCILKHPAFVTSVDFHPFDDSMVLTGCFDKKLRFWDVPSGTVLQRATTASFVTACKFNQSGEMAVAGLYIGHIVLFQMAPFGYDKPVTSGMRYYTQIETRNKTGLEKKNRKITSVRFVTVSEKTVTGDVRQQEHMLVTTNEGKIRSRLYRMDDFSLVCKYKGAANTSMLQIGSVCSDDGRHIICGSEDRNVVVWRLKNDLIKMFLGGKGSREECETYESFHATTSGPVTVACFLPDHLVRSKRFRNPWEHASGNKTSSLPAHNSSLGAEDHYYHEQHPHSHVRDSSTDSSEPDTSNTAHMNAEDRVGLSGSYICAAGVDGILAIFDIS